MQFVRSVVVGMFASQAKGGEAPPQQPTAPALNRIVICPRGTDASRLTEFDVDPRTHTLLDVGEQLLADPDLRLDVCYATTPENGGSHSPAATTNPLLTITLGPCEDGYASGTPLDPFDPAVACVPLGMLLPRLLPAAAARGELEGPAGAFAAASSIRVHLIVAAARGELEGPAGAFAAACGAGACEDNRGR